MTTQNITAPGSPYYADEAVTLYHGDCREVVLVLVALEGLAVDCIVADPPYNETSLPWDRWPYDWATTISGAAKSMWCFGSMRMFLDWRDQFALWKLSQDVVWRKQNGSNWAADRFKRVHEHALHWYQGDWALIHHEVPRVYSGVKEKGRVIRNGALAASHLRDIGGGAWEDDGTRLMPSVVEVPNMWRRDPLHPTEKPVGILDPLIRYACPPGGTVLDQIGRAHV